MEKIKYHQNGIGWDYDADGKLTDNWDPSLDYGNEYVKVYFRLGTPSYSSLSFFGFETQEAKAAWHDEASAVLKSLGIREDCGYDVERSQEKEAYLYPHPQNISGVVRKNDVQKIAEAISTMKLSALLWVDLYETVYVMSDSEYTAYLETRKAEIHQKLFAESQTNRVNTYVNSFDAASYIASCIMLHRLGDDNRTKAITVNYILSEADKMADSGYLKTITNDTGKYIRSLNKTEQRKAKLNMDTLKEWSEQHD